MLKWRRPSIAAGPLLNLACFCFLLSLEEVVSLFYAQPIAPLPNQGVGTLRLDRAYPERTRFSMPGLPAGTEEPVHLSHPTARIRAAGHNVITVLKKVAGSRRVEAAFLRALPANVLLYPSSV